MHGGKMSETDKKLEEIQTNAFEALKLVTKILDENNIDYFLLAGSTLGAVRHGGFIPWDDDIDLGIFLKDKQVVAKLLHDNMPEPYEWIDRYYCNNYPRYYGKILCKKMGCVDVFLLVKTSDNAFFRRFQWGMRKILFKIYKAKLGYVGLEDKKTLKGNLKLFFGKVISMFFSRKVIENMTIWNENLYEKKNVKYYVNFYSRYSLEKELIKSEWLSKKSKVFFNGNEFATVGDTDEYLTHLYGDYMKLPPVENRISGHGEYFGEKR